MTRDDSSGTIVVGDATPKSMSRGNSTEKLWEKEFLVTWQEGDAENPRNWSEAYKWFVFIVYCAQQFNANAISTLWTPGTQEAAKELGVSEVVMSLATAMYLFGFGVGPSLVSGAAERWGRKVVEAPPLALIAIFQIPTALAPNVAVVLVFRFLAGCACAGTFNAAGVVADLWPREERGWPTAFFVLNSIGGSNIAAGFAGYLVMAVGWRWTFGIGGISTAFMLLFVFLPFAEETHHGVRLKRRAKKLRRETGDERYFADHEMKTTGQHPRQIIFETLLRPTWMLLTESIVFWFGLFESLTYIVIYLFIGSFQLIYVQYGFNMGEQNLAFFAIVLGFCIGFCMFPIQKALWRRAEKKGPMENGKPSPEARLLWVMPAGVLFSSSLLWFAWTSRPPVPWIVSMIALVFFGIGAFITFTGATEYVIASYGPVATSATGAQNLLRETLAGSLTIASVPMYKGLGNQWATTLLGCFAALVALVPFVLFKYGPAIRKRSQYHQLIVESIDT
ncbi:MFS general substrate transporter [Acaromyces ingoldii]|uniref:MFS general substrate transporter n=1 Tax=Acaromyces ingoldii TaxID=215250 RepID=A0A316YPY8_9BASI|nr:MFS general substrate transporter [Acaromyces ingoldii]PWN91349.1 MFS general substrate transporter [Acaromyces ingoldii]